MLKKIHMTLIFNISLQYCPASLSRYILQLLKAFQTSKTLCKFQLWLQNLILKQVEHPEQQ